VVIHVDRVLCFLDVGAYVIHYNRCSKRSNKVLITCSRATHLFLWGFTRW